MMKKNVKIRFIFGLLVLLVICWIIVLDNYFLQEVKRSIENFENQVELSCKLKKNGKLEFKLPGQIDKINSPWKVYLKFLNVRKKQLHFLLKYNLDSLKENHIYLVPEYIYKSKSKWLTIDSKDQSPIIGNNWVEYEIGTIVYPNTGAFFKLEFIDSSKLISDINYRIHLQKEYVSDHLGLGKVIVIFGHLFSLFSILILFTILIYLFQQNKKSD